MSQDLPRYRQLAKQLRKEILSARLKPGSPLPTEMELCATHEVSRHTAREALRILSEDGLIERRQGAGTVVADKPAPAFAQKIGDFDSILQYARDAHLTVFDSHPATEEELDRFGLTGSYHTYSGIRRAQQQPPQALTTVLISARYAPEADVISSLSGAISEWLETEHRVSIAKVVQRMEAADLTRQESKKLEVPYNTPALRTVRRYRNIRGQIILLSESLHPAGRFAYEIRLDRQTN